MQESAAQSRTVVKNSTDFSTVEGNDGGEDIAKLPVTLLEDIEDYVIGEYFC